MRHILIGDVLTGETGRLRVRVGQLYDRLESPLKQVLREGELSGELPNAYPVQAIANVLLAVAEGRMNQFVRSGFLSANPWNCGRYSGVYWRH